jgi:hypothetical protein
VDIESLVKKCGWEVLGSLGGLLVGLYQIGKVFKGIVIKKGRHKVLTVFTLAKLPDLELLYAQAAQAIQDEKGRKTRAKKQLDDAFAYIEDLEEVY